MELRTQPRVSRPSEHTTTLAPPGATALQAEAPRAVAERSVRVQHGIHSGQFPVAGLRVGEARQTLTRLLNVDPQAVAVINGQVVGEDHVIGDDVALLTFVKPSAIKG
jgi:hypothetical protein